MTSGDALKNEKWSIKFILAMCRYYFLIDLAPRFEINVLLNKKGSNFKIRWYHKITLSYYLTWAQIKWLSESKSKEHFKSNDKLKYSYNENMNYSAWNILFASTLPESDCTYCFFFPIISSNELLSIEIIKIMRSCTELHLYVRTQFVSILTVAGNMFCCQAIW